MEEIWKDIEGYSMYQVSNLGRVRSLKRGLILKPRTTSGYSHVNISRLGVQKEVSVHRLVATAFIPNPNNYPCVNHKNEIKTDNRVENLEWCSYSYNLTYGTRAMTDEKRELTKERRRKYNREYNKKHREERAAYYREYHNKHKEALNVYCREYHNKHKETLNARVREYRKRKKLEMVITENT